MLKESPERFVPDLVGRIDAEDPDSLIVDLSTYQVFDADSAVVTLMYTNIASNGLGIVVWNLEPGQENDFHRHPDTEHIHVMLAGEAEYTLADRPPVIVSTSWDDDSASGLRIAELLSARGLPGTFYVPTARLGEGSIFGGSDLRALSTSACS